MVEHVVVSVITRECCGRTRCDSVITRSNVDEHVVMRVITKEYCGRTCCDECDHAGVSWKTRCDEYYHAGILWTNTL